MGDDGRGQECDGQLQRTGGADRAGLAAGSDELEQHLQLDGSEWSHTLCAGSVDGKQHALARSGSAQHRQVVLGI